MTNANMTHCPGCGRHCPLNATCCERGERFAAENGVPVPAEEARQPRRGRPLYEEMDTDGKLLWTLRSLGRYLHEFHEGRASQERILGLLSKESGVTQRALTERLGVQPGTASEVFGKLENAGLIERVPSESDRRTWEVRLTESGRSAAKSAEEERLQRREGMFRCFTEEQRGQLLGLLESLQADWQERYGHPHGPRRPGRGIPYAEGEVHAIPHRGHRGEESHVRTLPHHPDEEGGARPLPHHPRHGAPEEAARPLPHRPHGGDDRGPKTHKL